MITGGSGAIGAAIAQALGSAGFDLILAAREATRLQKSVQDLEAAGVSTRVLVERMDVTDSQQVSDTLRKLAQEVSVIDVLVNGAGVSGGGITAEVDDALWHNVIDTNLNGTFYVSRDALRLGLIPKGGSIINIASTGGKQGVLHGAPYSASKHAVVGFTKSLGLELARNGSQITVNAVCPGFVESDMAQRVREHYSLLWQVDTPEVKRRIEARVPLGRYIDPQEVAAMVVYLASPGARGVTAQALNVCGGLGNY
jgi:ketoreductase